MRYNLVMPIDPSGYTLPIPCMVRTCGEETVFEDYVTRADGVESLDLRVCEHHKAEWDRTGTVPDSD